MKSRIKDIKGTRKQLNVEMPKEKVELVFAEVFEDIKKSAEMPGFRTGKVPMEIVKKRYGQHAHDEVKKRIIPSAYQKALAEHEVVPVSYPDISDVLISPSGSLSFTAQFDAEPKVKLKKYTGIKVKKKKEEVSDEEVQKAIDKIREMNPEFEDKSGVLEKGDHAICDIETFSEGKAISKKRQDMWVEVDREASMLGMGKQLEGLKPGEEKEIDSTLPENYPDKKYAGKKVVFKVKVKQVKIKKVLPESEQLAGKVGKKDMAELREEIRQQLAQRKDMNTQIDMKNQVMEYLLSKNTFHVPETMVKRQQKVLEERAQNELAQKGVSGEAFEEHREKFGEQLFIEAQNKVKLYFILTAIAEEEKIEVSQQEVEAWLKKLGESYGQSLEDVEKYYSENNLMDGLREQLKEEKTIEYLLEEAQIVDK